MWSLFYCCSIIGTLLYNVVSVSSLQMEANYLNCVFSCCNLKLTTKLILLIASLILPDRRKFEFNQRRQNYTLKFQNKAAGTD